MREMRDFCENSRHPRNLFIGAGGPRYAGRTSDLRGAFLVREAYSEGTRGVRLHHCLPHPRAKCLVNVGDPEPSIRVRGAYEGTQGVLLRIRL